jgi:predicted RND superfamily exporter protein
MSLANITPTRAKWICALALVLTALFVALNLRVPSGGIVENALLDRHNPYRVWDGEARTHTSITPGDTLSFVLDFPGGMTHDSLRQIVRMTQEIQQRFPEGPVWSLAANSRLYQTTDAQLDSHAHLDARLPNGVPDTLDLAQWKARVRQDSSAYGTLVGKNFDHAQILVFLPEDHDELALADRVAEYLEQRQVSQIEWLLWKGDIHPSAAYANVSLGGWAVARGLMHYALISDVLLYSTAGLLVATVAAMLSLGSWRQAVQVTVVIFASFVWVRGSIPLLEWLGVRFDGEPVRERVYFLLVLSALIVSGISFNVRAFEAFNDAWLRERSVGLQPDAARVWTSLRPLGLRFSVVALIAILNFATLPQIGIRGILEVGVLSALGVALQRVLVVTLLPALHLLAGGVPRMPTDTPHTPATSTLVRHGERLSHAYRRGVHALPGWAHGVWSRRSPRQSLALSLTLTLGTLALALGVVAHDMRHPEQPWVVVRERPIDYLPHTIVDRGRALLNRPDSAGFGTLHFLVLPGQGPTTSAKDPAFIARVAALQARVSQVPGALSAHSILDKLGEVSLRDPEHPAPLPTTAQQAHERLQLIRWDLDSPSLAPHFWSDEGYVLFVAHPADDSGSLRQFADQVMAVARQEFPELTVLPFGRLHTYHQTDAYISQGKPLNVLTSFPLVVLVCGLWLTWQRRTQAQAGAHTLAPWRTALAISVPFVFAYSVIVVVMAVFGIPLDQATACATALGINAAIDFDIYVVDDFMQALHARRSPDQALAHALRDRGHVTLVDAKLNAICFSFLMASAFVPIQRLGVLMVVMLLACAFGALFLMTGVLRSCAVPHRAAVQHPTAPATAR